tara:strand:- start:11039 stop:11413 length:375 start_codon:yes stop_codon:yes gene_type:complete
MAKLRKGSKVRKSKRGGNTRKLKEGATTDEEELKKFAEEYEVDTHGSHAPHTPPPSPPPSPPSKKGGKTRKSKKKSHKKTKRKMNAFMTMMLDAKKHKKPSFVYKGKKYKQAKTKTGLVIYKKD